MQSPTCCWHTEYDAEFPSKLGLPTDRYLPAPPTSDATARSHKRGFVHIKEYNNLVGWFRVFGPLPLYVFNAIFSIPGLSRLLLAT